MTQTQRVLTVCRDVMAGARVAADDFRRQMTEQGTLVVHLISSPGAGKTALLEATAKRWSGRESMAVLVGDIVTDRDARRVAPWAPVVQLSTGGACHLELSLVRKGLEAAQWPRVDYLFIEDVGNLVCPASHDLGEHLRVIVLSTTEGDDKPGKYPKAFRTSHVLVINKLDLLEHVPFSLEAAIDDARRIQPDLAVLPMSARTEQGVDAWCDFLSNRRQAVMEHASCKPTHD